MTRFSPLAAGVTAGVAVAAALVAMQYRNTDRPAPSRDLTLAGSAVTADHQLEAAERGLPTATVRQARWSIPQPTPAASPAPMLEAPVPMPEIETPAPVELPAATPAPAPVPEPEPATIAAAPSGMGVMSLAPGATVSAVPLPTAGDLPVAQASWPSKMGAMDQGPAPTFGAVGGGRCRGQGGMPTGLVLR